MNRSIVAGLADGTSSTPRAELAEELEAALRAHDLATRESGPLWLGAEPTFTDRTSEAPEWLSEALGQDKEQRAKRLLRKLAAEQSGAIVLRPLGRQYSSEPEPRWCYGLYARRDAAPIWSGPPDLLLDGVPSESEGERLESLRALLVAALRDAGWSAEAIATPAVSCVRLLCWRHERAVCCDPSQDERLDRPTIHRGRIEGAGLGDPLATEQSFLVLLHQGAGGAEANEFWVELPAFDSVRTFLAFLEPLAKACERLAVRALGLRGFAPPIDETVAWTTLTPDPAVLEVNQAPQPDMSSFHRQNALLFRLAAEVGLSPYRLQYNGTVSDSGGGGQLTFGGPDPSTSPFFSTPELLPRLIRYLIRHPALSYWFATHYVGGSSQSPRPDEGVRESFLELDVALEQLTLHEPASPQILWATLRHFLADSSGNPHRSELNIEKLHNPYLPGRGCLGLVEFRALAMAKSLEVSTARALLIRAVVAMLRRRDLVDRLVHWGDELHDRFALPYFLARDLREVLADLETVGLGLGPAIEQLLLSKPDIVLGTARFEGCELVLEQALEFWPLVGDVASQEGGGSRVVDASTARIQVRLSATGNDAAARVAAIEVTANGHRIPLQYLPEADGATGVIGLRYRSFEPWTGMHPAMPAERSVTIALRNASGRALKVTLHPWRPGGEAYPGLPDHLEDAAARRLERAVIEELPVADLPAVRDTPSQAVTPCGVDLRRLDAPSRG